MGRVILRTRPAGPHLQPPPGKNPADRQLGHAGGGRKAPPCNRPGFWQPMPAATATGSTPREPSIRRFDSLLGGYPSRCCRRWRPRRLFV